MAEKRLVSWNVNGIRACLGKGFAEAFAALDADILCLQETKVQAGQVDFAPEGYRCYWNYAREKRLFRHGGILARGACKRGIRHGHPRA